MPTTGMEVWERKEVPSEEGVESLLVRSGTPELPLGAGEAVLGESKEKEISSPPGTDVADWVASNRP